MKKLSILLSLVLIFCAVIPLGAAAEAAAAQSTPDDALVRHYNFYDLVSGTRPKNLTYTPGSAKDTKYSLYASNVKTENGLGIVTGSDTKSYYSNSDKDDLTALSDMTLFLAFRYEGTPTANFAYVLQMAGVLNIIIDSNGLLVRTNDGKWLNGTDSKQNTKHPVKAGEDIRVAVSLDWNEDFTALNSTVQISNDNGKTYTAYEKNDIQTTSVPAKFTAFTFGKSKAGAADILDFLFDDFRIYSRALTTDEMQNIQLDATPTVAPFNVHAQTRLNSDADTFDVRFCAALDSLQYSAVGFEIVAKDAAGNELKTAGYETKSVYESVLALGETVTAADLGGTYLIAYKITDIPVSVGTVTFEITPFAVCNGITWFGRTGSYAASATN